MQSADSFLWLFFFFVHSTNKTKKCEKLRIENCCGKECNWINLNNRSDAANELLYGWRQVSFKVESNFRKYMCIKNKQKKLTKNKLGFSYVCFEFSFLWYRFSNMLQKQQREKGQEKHIQLKVLLRRNYELIQVNLLIGDMKANLYL